MRLPEVEVGLQQLGVVVEAGLGEEVGDGRALLVVAAASPDDVTGPVQTVTDLDGGFGGCDPWTNPASYTGGVVILDAPLDGCSIARRFDAARDAGVAALIINATGCFSISEPSLVAVCMETLASDVSRILVAA